MLWDTILRFKKKNTIYNSNNYSYGKYDKMRNTVIATIEQIN